MVAVWAIGSLQSHTVAFRKEAQHIISTYEAQTVCFGRSKNDLSCKVMMIIHIGRYGNCVSLLSL